MSTVGMTVVHTYSGAEIRAIVARKPLLRPKAVTPATGQASLANITGNRPLRG